MTREDKRAYNYARDRLANDDYPVYSDEYELKLAYKAGIKDAKNHPHWISVEDELPNRFAIITNGDDVLVGKYNFEKGLWGVRNKTMFAYTLLPANWKVTHWMPLPKAPVLSNLEKTGKDLKGGEK